MPRLKKELRETALICRQARINYRDSQRPPREDKTPAWKTSLERDRAAWRMTKLCIFRAHLRGVKHITHSAQPIEIGMILHEIQREFALKG